MTLLQTAAVGFIRFGCVWLLVSLQEQLQQQYTVAVCVTAKKAVGYYDSVT